MGLYRQFLEWSRVQPTVCDALACFLGFGGRGFPWQARQIRDVISQADGLAWRGVATKVVVCPSSGIVGPRVLRPKRTRCQFGLGDWVNTMFPIPQVKLPVGGGVPFCVRGCRLCRRRDRGVDRGNQKLGLDTISGLNRSRCTWIRSIQLTVCSAAWVMSLLRSRRTCLGSYFCR